MISAINAFSFDRCSQVGVKLLQEQQVQTHQSLTQLASINHYLESLLLTRPPLILGLGVHSRSNKQIYLETQATNRFRGRLLGSASQVKTVTLPNFLPQVSPLQLSTHLGTSYCNYISWQLCQLIISQLPDTRYTFLHLPKNLPPTTLYQQIQPIIAGFIQTNS